MGLSLFSFLTILAIGTTLCRRRSYLSSVRPNRRPLLRWRSRIGPCLAVLRGAILGEGSTVHGAFHRLEVAGLPGTGEHNLGSGCSASRQFRCEPDAPGVGGKSRLDAGCCCCGCEPATDRTRRQIEHACSRVDILGTEREHGLGGTVLEVAHVSSGTFWIRLGSPHGDKDRSGHGGFGHVAPLQRSNLGAS